MEKVRIPTDGRQTICLLLSTAEEWNLGVYPENNPSDKNEIKLHPIHK